MHRFIIALLVAVITVGGAVTLAAASQTVETTAQVEVRVWEHVSTENLYLSTRPAEGEWTTHNTPLDMSELHEDGNFYMSSHVTVEVPLSLDVLAEDSQETEGSEQEDVEVQFGRCYQKSYGAWAMSGSVINRVEGATITIYGSLYDREGGTLLDQGHDFIFDALAMPVGQHFEIIFFDAPAGYSSAYCQIDYWEWRVY